jgi:hypothetical protein
MSKEITTLEDLDPRAADFTLKSGGTYRLRAITLADHIWFKRKYPAGIDSIFQGDVNIEEIINLTYRLLDQDGRKQFVATDVELTDENGEQVKIRKTGPELFAEKLNPAHDLKSLLAAIMKTIGISNDAIEGMEATVSKKKDQSVKSKK